MKYTPNTVFCAFRRCFEVVMIEFSTLATKSVQTTASNSTHGLNRMNDVVEMGSGRFI